MDPTTWLGILIAVLATSLVVTTRPWYGAVVAPGTVGALRSQVLPRLIAETAIRLLSDQEVLTDPQRREAVLTAAEPPLPHPAIRAAVECVGNDSGAVSLRAALSGIAAQRIAAAAELPAWVRSVIGAGRVLSPGLVAVMCLAMLIAGSTKDGLERTLPFAVFVVASCAFCLLTRRAVNKAVARVEAYESLVFEITLSAGDAAASSLAAAAKGKPVKDPAARIKSGAMNALHASLAATRYRRAS